MKNVFMMMLVVLVVLLQACAVCTAQATRCSGNTAEICDSRGHWRTLMDCDEVEGESSFSCQQTMVEGESGEDEEGHTCLPEQGDEQ